MKEEQIINAARELFKNYGFKKVSMDEIANLANVSKVTIYSYFKDKDDLLNYFIEEEILSMKEQINNNYNENITFFDNLHDNLLTMLKYRNEQQLLLKLTQEANYLNNIKLKSKLLKLDENITNFIKEKLDDAESKGYIKKVNNKLLATVIFSSYTSVILKYDEFKKTLSDTEISNNLINIIKNGLMLGDETNE